MRKDKQEIKSFRRILTYIRPQWHRLVVNVLSANVIGQRFSSVITADMIAVRDDGRIAALNQHDELAQTCTLYQNLYETKPVKHDPVLCRS